VKTTKALKLALLCLLIGILLGAYLRGRLGRRPAAAAPYADLAADFEARAALPGQVVVDFADDVDDAYVDALGRRLGIAFRAESDYSRVDRLYVGSVDPAREAADLAALRADPRVESAEEEFVYGLPEAALDPADEGIADRAEPARGRSFPNDPRYDEQWHLDQIHMPATWSAATGEGVIVAVIDTGVSRVEDLAQTEFVAGWNFVDNNADTDDDHGHGTHVAGTIAQSTHNGVGVAGVAYRAKIMPLKVLSASGSGSVAGIAQAIRWAADHGAKVMNMSLGGPMYAQSLAQAVKYAHDHGVVVVCAAGNDGRGKVSYPAAHAGAIAVAATQKDERTTFYSNWGKAIAIAAPGGNTRESPSGGVLQNTRYQGKEDYYFFMGTSMASPHVAGVAALLVSQGVSDPDAVLRLMQQTARRPDGMEQPPADYAAHYGAGIVDAEAGVKKAQLDGGELPLALGGGLTALVLFALARRRRLAHFGLGGAAAMVVGACGLFVLPRLGLGGLPGVALVAHGFPAWDEALLGAAGHGNPLFYSALAPLALALLLYGFPRLRGMLAGFALGVAGHLLAQLFTHTVDVRWVPLDQAWLVANGVVCAALGWAVARR
jgi:serine protease